MFYRLEIEVEKKGDYAKREVVPHDYDWRSERSQANLSKFALPDYEPVFSDLLLSKESIYADFVWDLGAIGSIGLLVSNKVKTIFEHHNLPVHRFYPLKVRGDKGYIQEHQYYWMHVPILDEYYDWIDYQRSRFVIKNKFEKTSVPISISNSEQLNEAADKYFSARGALSYEKIVLNDKYQKTECS